VRLLADHCDLYNAALAERREAWRIDKVSVSYGDQSAQLKEIRAADPGGQGRHSFTAQQQSLRRLKRRVAAYLRRARDAKGSVRSVGYPRFKPYQRFNQVLFVAGDGAKWKPADASRWAYASFQAVGRVKGRAAPAGSGSGQDTAAQAGGPPLVCDRRRRHRARAAANLRPVGWRRPGSGAVLTTSDGEIISQPAFLDAARDRLADLQRRKARARPGSATAGGCGGPLQTVAQGPQPAARLPPQDRPRPGRQPATCLRWRIFVLLPMTTSPPAG
jgi:putative transposase